jgi:hypothetical protein
MRLSPEMIDTMARGDRLAVERRLAGTGVPYTHHGIDLGDGTVVHARPDDPERIFDGGRVDRTSHAEFAAGAPVRVVTDPPARYSPDEIVARAVGLLGRDGYCPVVENCEHFATWCATGERQSRQVDLLVERRKCGAHLTRRASARTADGRTTLTDVALESVGALPAIWEFAYRDEKWVPVRERGDKSAANTDFVVEQTLLNIREAIALDELVAMFAK